MLRLTFFLLSLPQVLADEYLLVQSTSVIKNLILNLEEKPDSNRFLFVNVAWDKALIPKTESIKIEGEKEGFEVPIGNEPITDRGKLAVLFELLAAKPQNHRFVLLDVYLKGETEHDSVLSHYINQLPNVVVSYHRDGQDKPDKPDLPIQHIGLSDMETVYGMRMKFKILLNDSLKTTPLIMQEKINKEQFKAGEWFDYLGDKPVLRSFILDYRIRGYDYAQTQRYAKVHLGEWLSTVYNYDTEAYDLREDFYKLVKDRIVVIGDFEDRDIHETIYGDTPGPLVLLNTFLALEQGDNQITIGFLLFLFLSYALVSYYAFSHQSVYRDLLKLVYKKIKKKEDGFFESLSLFIFFFGLISVISFFIFGIHISVLVLAFYMYLLDKIETFLRQRIEKWQSAKPLVESES